MYVLQAVKVVSEAKQEGLTVRAMVVMATSKATCANRTKPTSGMAVSEFRRSWLQHLAQVRSRPNKVELRMSTEPSTF